MKIFEFANVRNSRGNGCPVIKHVITRVNPEKTRKNQAGIFPTFLVMSWYRGPICVGRVATSIHLAVLSGMSGWILVIPASSNLVLDCIWLRGEHYPSGCTHWCPWRATQCFGLWGRTCGSMRRWALQLRRAACSLREGVAATSAKSTRAAADPALLATAIATTTR
jgi:hypothetical protein